MKLMLYLLTGIFVIILLTNPSSVAAPGNAELDTIILITGLLFITTATKESNYLNKLVSKALTKAGNERTLAFFLIIITAALSMFLTNDVSLFIVIPLTLAIESNLANKLEKIIIYEILAVNAGSALSPIGNPQNLFLWQKSKLSFFMFAWKMLPLFLILIAVLIVFAAITFKQVKLKIKPKRRESYDTKLFTISIIALAGFLVLAEINIIYSMVILLAFMVTCPKLIRKTDWMLVLLFILMFIDFHSISSIAFLKDTMATFILTQKTTYMASIFFSQIMSNVPASIFMSRFTSNWKAIAYGVNVGGNGLIISSLANIIALRLSKKDLLVKFHKHSLPYLIISSFLVYLIVP